MCQGGAYRVLLTYDCVNKPKPVKQVVVATKVILSNRCRVWTMFLCMNSIQFILEASSASIVWGRYYFVTTIRPFGGGGGGGGGVCASIREGASYRDITLFVLWGRNLNPHKKCLYKYCLFYSSWETTSEGWSLKRGGLLRGVPHLQEVLISAWCLVDVLLHSLSGASI